MLNSNLIPLVAQIINSRPRNLGLAGKTDQYLIKSFAYHLGWKLKTGVSITFAVWDQLTETLVIGYMPLQFREASQCARAAEEVIGEIKAQGYIEKKVVATIAGIPNRGLILLYDFTQAYEIAKSLQIADFSTIQFAYTACLHFAAADRKDIDADKWFDILCQFAHKCSSNGSWRTALLCLEQAEHLLGYLFDRFDYELDQIDDLILSLTRLGQEFQFADLPERSIDLARIFMPKLELLCDFDMCNDERIQQLESEILDWQKSSNEIWADNAPLIVIGKDFAKKLS